MADTKITALPASSGLVTTDLVPVVDDPSGTPVTQKATWQQVLDLANTTGQTGPINVITEHGATGDNSTDDLAAIQAAIDAAETAGGGVVYLPERQTDGSLAIYAISGILRVPSNVSLIGDMERVSRIRLTAAIAHVALGANGIGDSTNTDANLADNTTFVVDDPAWVSGDEFPHLDANTAGTVVIDASTTSTATFSSLTRNEDGTVTLNGFSGTGSVNAGNGVYIKQETQRHGIFGHIRITGNDVANYCLRLIGGSNRTYTNLWLDSAVLDCLYIDAVQNSSFDHIQVEGAGRYGIHITGGAKQLWFTDVSVDTCTNYGIYFGNEMPNNSNPTGVKENTNIRFENLHMENNVTDLVRVEAGNNIFFDSGRMVGGTQKLFSSIKVANVTEANVARVGVHIGKGLIGTSSAVVIDAQDTGALGGTQGLYRVENPYHSFGTGYTWTFDDEFNLEVGPVEQVNTESGTAWNLADTDAGMTTEATNASAKTVTIQPFATTPITDGNWFRFRNLGAGDLTILGGTGVTVNGTVTGSIVVNQYGEALVTKIDTNTWIAVGSSPGGGDLGSTAIAGDVTGTLDATVVGDDSHAHTGSTISALDTADVTTGTFADARIAQTNVTQHEAAINHDALTNFDADEHGSATTETVNTESGTAWNLAAADAGQTTEATNAAAKTATIQTNATTAVTAGKWFKFRNMGAGDLTIVGDTGVTVNGTAQGSITVPVYREAIVTKVDTDAWVAVVLNPEAAQVPFDPYEEITATETQTALEQLYDIATPNGWVNRIDTDLTLDEDFYGAGTADNQIGRLGWKVSTSGTAAALEHPSGLGHSRRLNAGSTNTGYAHIGLGSAAFFGVGITGFSQLDMAWLVTVPTLATATHNFICDIGIISGGGTDPVRGGFFRYLGDNTNLDWKCHTRYNTSSDETVTASGVTVSTSQVKLRMTWDGTNFVFIINGTQVASHTADIADTTSGFGLYVRKTTGSAADTALLTIDSFRAYGLYA